VPVLVIAVAGLFEGFFSRFNYLAPFTVLILCGLGAPFPEEVALIGSGILLYQGEVDFWAITLVCSSAILLGDSLPFWLGRRYGMAALKRRWVRRILHPERIAILERRFVEHGNWVVFSCRFMPGIRIPGYFFAGTMRMTYTRFLALDSLGVLVSVPTSIWLGKLFGQSITELQQRFDQLHLVLAFAVVTIVLVLFLRSRNRARERQATEANRRREVEKPPAGALAEAELPAAGPATGLVEPGEIGEAPPGPVPSEGTRVEAGD
jgi:membrane protein DedA with SNARE-associated domain